MSKIGLLRAWLLELVGEHQNEGTIPTSGRFLSYELVQRGQISKERKPNGGRRPDQDMTEALTQLRESGQIPWGWIVDETRTLYNFGGYTSIKAGVEDLLSTIRLDPWADDIPLVLTESRSLTGVLRPLCIDYCVQIAATNGQVGGFLHTVILPMLQPLHRVLYLGDYDLAGGDIETNTRRVLEREAGQLRWERLALTQVQVEDYQLPVIIKHDHRFADGGAHEAVETEALSQRIIIEIVRGRLETLLPEPLEDVLAREKEQQDKIDRLLKRLT